MRRSFLFVTFVVVSLPFAGNTRAQDTVIPAGTLLRCTINESNFSSSTTEVGDPLICHPGALQEFGRDVFPRGAYLTGHLEAYKNPGHFVGKGWMQLQFDRIGLPNTDLPVPGKIVSVRGFRVDREGKIIGHGHPMRDAVEWMFPPLWPWKILTLPEPGPRPTLKGEVPVTLRLMEDVTVPMPVALSQPSRQPAALFTTPRTSTRGFSVRYLPPTAPALTNRASTADPDRPPARLTLIVLKSEAIYAATDYWLESGQLIYVLPSKTEHTVDPSDVDWAKTTQLNAERGIAITLRNARHD